MTRKLLALVLALMMMVSCWSTALAADNTSQDNDSGTYEVIASEEGGVTASAPAGQTIVVALQSGKGKARLNYNKLSAALRKANNQSMTTVIIKNPGQYYIRSAGESALMFRSNTILDLNGSELIRSGSMLNMIQNCKMNGSRSGGGYSVSKNITIRNGTLNGSGGKKAPVNLVNIGHASNITFSNLRLYNCRGGHLIEMTACRNSVVQNCVFSGYQKCGGEPGEALQLDTPYKSWNGVYTSDTTPCKNILVKGCLFKNYPSGVGNHHTIKGHHNSNIRIINNTFTCASSNMAAIWCFGFDNSEVSGNTFLGKYACGVRVGSGSVKVNNNTFGSPTQKINYQAVYVVREYSHVVGRSKRVIEYVKGGTVNNNVIYSNYKASSIEVTTKSRLASIANNTLVSSKGNVVKVQGQSKVSTQRNNKKRSSL